MTAQAKAPTGLQIRVLDRARDLPEDWGTLASAWNAPIFHTPEFLRAYEAHPLQPISEQRFIEVRDGDGTLLSAIPAYLQADPFSAGDHQALLSTVRQGSDTWVLAAGSEVLGAACAAFAAEAAELGCERWGFVNVTRASCPEKELLAMDFELRATAPRWSLPRDLARSEDEYLALLSSRMRRGLRRYLRRAEEAGVTTHRHGPDVDPELLHALLDLIQASSARVGAPGYYDPEQFAGFLRALGERAELVEIRGQDGPLAVGVCFREGSRYRCWAPGYVRDSGLPFSPYYLLWWEALRAMWATDASVLECGRNNDDFKRRMGLVDNELVAAIGPKPDAFDAEGGI